MYLLLTCFVNNKIDKLRYYVVFFLKPTYRSGPFKRRVSNNRLSQIRAGGGGKSKLTPAGSQIRAGGRSKSKLMSEGSQIRAGGRGQV